MLRQVNGTEKAVLYQCSYIACYIMLTALTHTGILVFAHFIASAYYSAHCDMPPLRSFWHPISLSCIVPCKYGYNSTQSFLIRCLPGFESMIRVDKPRGCALNVVQAMRHLDASVFYCTSRQAQSRGAALFDRYSSSSWHSHMLLCCCRRHLG